MVYPMDYLDSYKKNILFSEDEDEFDFKYIPVNEFKRVVKSVKRKRTKEVVKKECISLAKQQIDRQTDLNNQNNDKTANFVSKTSKITEKIMSKNHGNQGKLNKNILLTIPEEINTVQSSDIFKSKSTSQNLKNMPLEMAGESCYKISRHIGQDSSTDLSSNSKTNKEILERRFRDIFLQPDLHVTYQVLTIQRKISDILDEISHRLNNIPLPDGENDLQRRQQRILEFSIRFSRNYLYDLSRQVADIQRHLSVVLENEGIRFSKRGLIFHRQTIEQKLVVVHQLLLNALSVYCKHIPSSTLKGQPGKLKAVLEMVIDLREICIKINLTPEYMGFGDNDELPWGKDIEEKCVTILSKLKISLDTETQLYSQSANSIASPIVSLKKRNVRNNKSILYKYNRNIPLGRKQRMRKTGGFFQKTRKQPLHIVSGKNCNEDLKSKSSPGLNAISISREENKHNSTKIKIPPKEDEIKTMMDMIESTDDESNTESPNPVTGIVITEPSEGLKKKLPSQMKSLKYQKKIQNYTDQDLTNVVPLISDLMSVIEEKRNQNAQQKNVSSVKTKSDVVENMQLINLKEEPKAVHLNDVSCQATNDDNVKSEKDKYIVLSVDDTAKNNLLEYKSTYKSYLESNPMYFNNKQNKPWKLVSWIAEKLVDELIVDVSKEFQIDHIIKKILELEFQDF